MNDVLHESKAVIIPEGRANSGNGLDPSSVAAMVGVYKGLMENIGSDGELTSGAASRSGKAAIANQLLTQKIEELEQKLE